MVEYYILSKEQIKAIESALEKGIRIEIVPVKNGVRIKMIERHDLRIEK